LQHESSYANLYPRWRIDKTGNCGDKKGIM
jgi:hypothetical protein